MSPAVLDASALLAWRDEEPGADIVDGYLSEGILCSVTLGEVQYKVAEFGDDPIAFTEDVQALGVQVVDFTAAHAALLPELKELDLRSRGTRRRGPRLSLGDMCCIAVALEMRLPLVTGDRHWSSLDLPVPVINYQD